MVVAHDDADLGHAFAACKAGAAMCVALGAAVTALRLASLGDDGGCKRGPAACSCERQVQKSHREQLECATSWLHAVAVQCLAAQRNAYTGCAQWGGADCGACSCYGQC